MKNNTSNIGNFSEFLLEMARPSKFSTHDDIAKAISEFDNLPQSKKSGVAVTILRNADKIGYTVKKPEILKFSSHRENMDKNALKKVEKNKEENKIQPLDIEDEDLNDEELKLKPGYNEKDFAKEFDDAIDDMIDEIKQAKGTVLVSELMGAMAEDIGISFLNLKKILKNNSKYMSSNNDIYAIIKGEPMKRTTYQVTMASAIEKLKGNKELRDQYLSR